MLSLIVEAVLGVIAFLLMLGGLIFADAAARRDTTVEDLDGHRIHNTGLIADRQASVTMGCTVAIVGAVLFGAVLATSAVNALAARQKAVMAAMAEQMVPPNPREPPRQPPSFM